MDKYRLSVQNSAFILIDLQANLANAMKKDVLENIEGNSALMIDACTRLNVPVLVTEQYKKGLGMTLGRIQTKLGDAYRPIEKLEFSCYKNQEFQDSFSKLNRKHVMIAGIEAHVCILQSALDFLGNGYFVHVIGDAVCSRYKSDWKHAMDYLRYAGAVVTTTEIAVFQLLQKAGTPEFKAVSPLFKDRERYWAI